MESGDKKSFAVDGNALAVWFNRFVCITPAYLVARLYIILPPLVGLFLSLRF